MSIELLFLKKAIEDKNYISFKYEKTSIKSAKPLKIETNEGKNILFTDVGEFDFEKVSKLTVLKDRF